MALAQPEQLSEDLFLTAAHKVREWFTQLNPYEEKGEILKVEDANYTLDGAAELPLYCFAVSAKRYALFNVDDHGIPLIRKGSAHGLGHLLSPYQAEEAPTCIPLPPAPLSDVGLERWQYDFWFQILLAGLGDRPAQPDLQYHPALDQAAISRYGATTPELLCWFKGYNSAREYGDRVKPFGFMTALHGAKSSAGYGQHDGAEGRCRRKPVRPIAPYTRDPHKAAEVAFDRETGVPISAATLQTFRASLSQYHLHPEAKFLNGDFTHQGRTERRHVFATGLIFIGKEANRWEEQFFTGLNLDASIEYGGSPEEDSARRELVRAGIERFGQHQAARAARMSLRDVGKAIRYDVEISPKHLLRLERVLATMATAEDRGT